MAPRTQGPHRLTHEEMSAHTQVRIEDLSKGDIFVMNGTPHMLVSHHDLDKPDTMHIVNLISGSSWPLSCEIGAKVHPAINSKLTFASTRRDT